MDVLFQTETERLRRRLAAGQVSPTTFRQMVMAVPWLERDHWLDRVFGLDCLPDDGPELPRGCVPYLPSSVDTVTRAAELAMVRSTDVFVDIGSGLGRVAALMHLLTGARTIGVEIQPALVRASRELSERLNASRHIVVVEGDAARLTGSITDGSVFFLYCPFSGERLIKVLDALKTIAQLRQIRVCSVDLPLPACSWLEPVAGSGSLAVHQSVRSHR